MGQANKSNNEDSGTGVHRLLDGRFAPVTDSFGFLQAPLNGLTDFFQGWLKKIHRAEHENLRCDLASALERVGKAGQFRTLLAATRSDWVAVFVDRKDSFHSEVMHPSLTYPCRGLCVRWAEHTINKDPKGQYGAVTLQTLADHRTDFLNIERCIDAGYYEEGWKFSATGPVLPFEQTELYAGRRIRDRFTPQMLQSYCRALGIDVFNADFYGPEFVLFEPIKFRSTAAIEPT